MNKEISELEIKEIKEKRPRGRPKSDVKKPRVRCKNKAHQYYLEKIKTKKEEYRKLNNIEVKKVGRPYKIKPEIIQPEIIEKKSEIDFIIKEVRNEGDYIYITIEKK
jgi:hypothetical protein